MLGDLLLNTIPLVMREWRRELHSGLPAELSINQFRVLYFVSLGQGSSTYLARHQGVSPAAMSKMVERLVGLKYLRRSTSVKDRRQHVLQLSPKGAKAVQKVRSQVARRLQERLDKLPISEQKKISQALKSLNDLFALNLENTL